MRKKQNGFINIIIYILIFIIFAVTIYFCLDVLEIIEVPEEYSLVNTLEGYLGETEDFQEIQAEEGEERSIKKHENSSSDLYSENISAPDLSSATVTYEPLEEDTSEFSYYSQLDNYAKIIYNGIEDNLDNMKTGTYNVDFGTTFNDLLHEENGEEVLSDAFQLAINSLNFDNPELFYIDISKIYLLTKITTRVTGTTYTVEIGASEGKSYLNDTFEGRVQVEKALAQVKGQKLEIENSLGDTVEEKIRGVHDYLIDNLEYDSTLSSDNIYNIYGALINKYTVCEGYARAFKAIMDDLGIPCLIACGIGQNSSGNTEDHAWNYVMINGKWYAIDVTWDDPIVIGNGTLSRDIQYRYYLKGSREFFKNHTENGAIVGNANFEYPELSLTDY